MFFCNRTLYFKDNLCLQSGIPVCIEVCRLAKKYNLEIKFHISYLGDNDRGMFTWSTSGIDEMNHKFEKFLHDSEYQKMNEKITKLTSERTSHDDLWREIDISK